MNCFLRVSSNMCASFSVCGCSRKRKQSQPKANALLGEERDGSQQDSDDIYARRMWQDCHHHTLPATGGSTAGIYGRTACHTHPLPHQACAPGGDYTQMLELQCSASATPPPPPPPGGLQESQYGRARQVKFVDPACLSQSGLNVISSSFAAFQPSDGTYDTSARTSGPGHVTVCCNNVDHYTLRRASDPDLLSPDKQPDVVQTNSTGASSGGEGVGGSEPGDNIRNLQQWLRDQPVLKCSSTRPANHDVDMDLTGNSNVT